jgi:hypothetical protein
LETLGLATSESNCHPFCSCAITGRQKDNADIAIILMKIPKRFGNIRL